MDNKNLKTFKSVHGQGVIVFIYQIITIMFSMACVLFLFLDKDLLLGSEDGLPIYVYWLVICILLFVLTLPIRLLMAKAWKSNCFSYDSNYLYVKDKKYDLISIQKIQYNVVTSFSGYKGQPMNEPNLVIQFNKNKEIKIAQVSIFTYLYLKTNLKKAEGLQRKREKISIKIRHKILYLLPLVLIFLSHLIALFI